MLIALGVCALFCFWAAVAAARPAIHRGHKRFVPVTGNWDGVADGFHASFELAYKPSYREYGSQVVPYGFANLALMTPSFNPQTCSYKGETPAQEVIGENDFTPVHRGGSFHLEAAYRLGGGLTGARSASLTVVYRIQGCRPLKLTWHFHPVRRRPVQDGTWKVSFSKGGSETIEVSAGGRLTALDFPSSYTCVQGGIGLFIDPSGTAGAETYGSTVMMHFTRTRASGKIRASTASGGCSETMSAKLTKRSA